jgi:hypothetical protein
MQEAGAAFAYALCVGYRTRQVVHLKNRAGADNRAAANPYSSRWSLARPIASAVHTIKRRQGLATSQKPDVRANYIRCKVMPFALIIERHSVERLVSDIIVSISLNSQK